MQRIVRFTGPRRVEIAELPSEQLGPAQVRVRTRYSGISAGTELTAYRGTNPYLTKTWDSGLRLFLDSDQPASHQYPLAGWGYSEVGEVVETAENVVEGPRVGDTVWGIWGHRSEAVLDASEVRPVPDGLDPLAASFARVGAVALNSVLAADMHVGEQVAIFGQGVIGLLATQLARRSGVDVVAVDALPARRRKAVESGAALTLDPASDPVAERMRQRGGADVALELSGSYPALHEAIRTVTVAGRVVAAGFYQGEGAGLRLGEEFHHNRVELVSSQIGDVPPRLAGRWDRKRLTTTFLRLCAEEAVRPTALVTHVLAPSEVEHAYRLLDTGAADALQIMLDFGKE